MMRNCRNLFWLFCFYRGRRLSGNIYKAPLPTLILEKTTDCAHNAQLPQLILVFLFIGEDDWPGPAGQHLQISQPYWNGILWPPLPGQLKSNGKNDIKLLPWNGESSKHTEQCQSVGSRTIWWGSRSGSLVFFIDAEMRIRIVFSK